MICRSRRIVLERCGGVKESLIMPPGPIDTP